MPEKQVSVVIPTFRDWARLQKCLDALTSQTLPASEFDILVANNAPQETIPNDLTLPSNCTIIPAAQPGSYAARNVAIDKVATPLIAFTDSDCLPDKDWLLQAITVLQDDPQINLVAGRIAMFWKDEHPTIVERYDSIFHLQQQDYVAAGGAATANLIARSLVFADVGKFNGALMSGGDNEWTKRATSAGHRLVYSADVIVSHPARHGLKEIVKKARRIAGGVIAKKREAGRSFVLPQFDRVIPSFKTMRRISNIADVTRSQAIRLFAMHYWIRLVTLNEQIRLMLPNASYRR